MAKGDSKPTIKDRLYDVPYLGVALRVQDRYVDDDADQYAAAIGFFGFLSLFPLLLLALAITGYVLRGDPQAQADVADAVIGAIPGFADTFQGDQSAIAAAVAGLADNAGSVGLAGLLTLLLTGLKVVNGASVATLHVFHVDADISGALRKLRQVGVLALLGVLAIAGVAATALVGAAATLATEGVGEFAGGSSEVNTALQLVATLGGLAGSVLADTLLFLGSYKLLTWGSGPRTREVLPGAILAALGWTALKAFGATYVSNQIAKTNELIGAFGGVVGLLLLLYLAGRVYLYGAEFTALIREPGHDLARRYDHLRYEGEDEYVLGPVFAARKAVAGGAVEVTHPEREPATAGGQDTNASAGTGRRDGPRAVSPRPQDSSPAVSAGTRARLRELDELRRERRDVGLGGPTGLGGTPGEQRRGVQEGRTPEGRADVRGAAAIAAAIGAVGGLVAAARPWKDRT